LNAQIVTIIDKAGCRSIMCWTCEQQLRQSAVHLWRCISESIFIADCSMHDYKEDRRTKQCKHR